MTEWTRGVQRLYDERVGWKVNHEFYEHSDFLNFGYWQPSTRSAREACETLLEMLLAAIPEKRGSILDVACGKGATTQYLLKYFSPTDVTAINISDKHLEICREKLPQVTFLSMDACRLDFEDASFDNIICVEAAFLFDTRERFLREAHRVLRPGGHLVLSDILKPKQFPRQLPANYVEGIDAYRELYGRAGFSCVDVVDATEPCIARFADGVCRFAMGKVQEGQMRKAAFVRIRNVVRLMQATHTYLLVHAAKT
ncbi:MAG: class I SAM-dependent methyltransferase [Rhodospirillales bacterium]